MSEIDLREYAATPRQKAVAEWFHLHPGASQAEAAAGLGLTKGTVFSALRGLRGRAAKKDAALHTRKAPEGYRLRGVSTQYNSRGEISSQWVKTAPEHQSQADVLATFQQALKDADLERALPRPVHVPDLSEDLLSAYLIGDAHVGMIADAMVSGEDMDLDTTANELLCAIDLMGEVAPRSAEAILFNVGDYFHADNTSRTTARSGHVLDADPRWHRVASIGVSLMIRCVDVALSRHERVEVVTRAGNHDDHTAWMLALCLHHRYQDEPRVTVDLTAGPFWYREWGSNLFGGCHGHGPKLDKLNEIMAADQPAAWGRTRHRQWWTGHRHHLQEIDLRGCRAKILRTMQAQDAYAHGEGYRSSRGLQVETWHRNLGRRGIREIGIEDVRGAR